MVVNGKKTTMVCVSDASSYEADAYMMRMGSGLDVRQVLRL